MENNFWTNFVSAMLNSIYMYSLASAFLMFWGTQLLFPKFCKHHFPAKWKTVFALSLLIMSVTLILKAGTVAIKTTKIVELPKKQLIFPS